MALKQGWTGRVFEDFQVGDVYEHPVGRTVIEADNIWFTCLTMNTNPTHLDGEYSKRTQFGRRLVNSCFTLAVVTGQSVIADSGYARKLQLGRLVLNNTLLAFTDAPPFERLGLNRRPALLLGMAQMRQFKRVAIDFSTRRVLFDLPDGTGFTATPGTYKF